MISRYIHLLNTLLNCPREIKEEIYMHLLLAPLIIKQLSSKHCRSKADMYKHAARDYSCQQSHENKSKIEDIISELKDLDKPA